MTYAGGNKSKGRIKQQQQESKQGLTRVLTPAGHACNGSITFPSVLLILRPWASLTMAWRNTFATGDNRKEQVR